MFRLRKKKQNNISQPLPVMNLRTLEGELWNWFHNDKMHQNLQNKFTKTRRNNGNRNDPINPAIYNYIATMNLPNNGGAQRIRNNARREAPTFVNRNRRLALTNTEKTALKRIIFSAYGIDFA